MKIHVSYMSGAGNLFSVIDNSIYKFTENNLRSLAKILCTKNEYNKNNAEGLLAINKSKINGIGFDVEFYNPDGSKDAMCGNGGRCAVSYAAKHHFLEDKSAKTINFSMAGEIYKSEMIEETIKLFFPSPKLININIEIDDNNKKINGDIIDVGTKHLVVPTKNISDLQEIFLNLVSFVEFAKPLRYNEKFQPHGINVSLYKMETDNKIHLRTYERGVEAQTGACGTGAISVAISAVKRKITNFPVKLIPPSGLEMIVDIEGSINNIRLISLQGGADILESYDVDIPKELMEGK